MWQALRTSVVMLISLTIITGGIYPLLVWGMGQTLFAWQANGSLLRVDEQAVGSEWIGQSFTKAEYFWGRLSATAPVPYHAAASSGSNLGPSNPALRQAVAARQKMLEAGPVPDSGIPVDLVTSSASGLDPHISPAAAEYQIPRVAAARKMSEADVRELVNQCTLGRQFGFLGEPCVHVLRLNLALDKLNVGR